jgi:hypothetical protein
MGYRCPQVASIRNGDTPNAICKIVARTTPRSRRLLTQKPPPSKAVDDLAVSQHAAVICRQFRLVCKGCLDRPRKCMAACDVRYRVPAIEGVAAFVTTVESAVARITIRYRSNSA